MTEQKTDSASPTAKANAVLLPYGGSVERPGWLGPTSAFAFYWANGQVRQLINRFSTMMIKSSWNYTNTDVEDFVWAPTQSKLETLKIKSAMQLAAKWAFIFGGAAIQHITEDPGEDVSTPCRPEDVHAYRKLKVWSAFDLRPDNGDYKTAQYFTPTYGGSVGDTMKIHRSRLSIIVVEEVPGGRARGMYTTQTGWPPSWLEGIYQSFCSLKNVHADVDQMMHTKSLVHLALEGWRAVQTSPGTDEAENAQQALDATLELLSNEKVLVTDVEDMLKEVSRDLAHIDKILERKELWYASASGTPKELVIMEAEGNLGTNSAPIDAYNDRVDGWRQTMYTPVLEDATDRALAAQKFEHQHACGEPLIIPTQYTIEHGPVAEQSALDKAKVRDHHAQSRERDAKSLPLDVIFSDPKLQEDYSGMATFLENKAEAKATAEVQAVASEAANPVGEDMVSASMVATKLGCSPATVHHMVSEGTIPGKKIGARWKFYMSQVLAALDPGELEEAQSEVDSRLDDPAKTVLVGVLGLSESDTFGGVYGNSIAMREIFAVLERVKDFDMAVLLLGETGTGKEGVARGLHGDGEFVAVNCAALPRGAEDVANAVGDSAINAYGGTLFLDEVGDLSREGQSAILRVLSGMGDSEFKNAKGQVLAPPRVVSATSLDIHDGDSFRPDLYYRLAGVEVEIPPLRDREDDVHWLAYMFYKRACEASGMDPAKPEFTESALAAMLVYAWPGNIRELRSSVERGIALAGWGRPVGVEHMQLRYR